MLRQLTQSTIEGHGLPLVIGTWGYQSYPCTGVGPGFLQFQSIGNGGARTLLPENGNLVVPTLGY